MLVEKEPYGVRARRFVEQFLSVYALGQKVFIPFLVVSVGQACSLRCKDCANFSPYAPPETKSYPAGQIIDHLNMIFQVAQVGLIQLQGGEPFCCNELWKIIDAIPVETSVRIATNGTVIPNDKTLTSIRAHHATVRVSDYKFDQEVSKKIENFREYLDQNRIHYTIYKFTTEKDYWVDFGGKDTERENSQKIADQRFWTCSFGRDCLTLENFLMGYCSRSVIALSVQPVKYREKDYFNIKETQLFRFRLLKYIYWKHTMECCRYCCGMASTLIKPGIQIA